MPLGTRSVAMTLMLSVPLSSRVTVKSTLAFSGWVNTNTKYLAKSTLGGSPFRQDFHSLSNDSWLSRKPNRVWLFLSSRTLPGASASFMSVCGTIHWSRTLTPLTVKEVSAKAGVELLAISQAAATTKSSCRRFVRIRFFIGPPEVSLSVIRSDTVCEPGTTSTGRGTDLCLGPAPRQLLWFAIRRPRRTGRARRERRRELPFHS